MISILLVRDLVSFFIAFPECIQQRDCRRAQNYARSQLNSRLGSVSRRVTIPCKHSRLLERVHHSRRASVALVTPGDSHRRLRASEFADWADGSRGFGEGCCGGGCVDARSHPGVSLAPGLPSLLDRPRRLRVLTARCMVLPQKQVGSAPFDSRPIIRKRISAPQTRFGHSHHSSRLFFTNATSARSNAPRRCTCPLRAPHDAGQHFRPRVHSGLKGLLAIIWRSAIILPGKRCCSLTIATGVRAVGFHPKSWIFCGDDVCATLVPAQPGIPW